MKGGKGGRKRKGSHAAGKPAPIPPKSKGGAPKRSPSVAPKKGSRKNTEYGWSSTSEE